MNDTQSKIAGSEVAKASILAEAAEIAMGGWHSVEKARAFACSVSDYLLAATQPNAAPAAEVVADALRAFVDIKPLGYGAVGTRDVDMAQWNEAHRAAKVCLEALAAPAAAIDAREQEITKADVLRVAKEVGLVGWISDCGEWFEFTETQQPSKLLIQFAEHYSALASRPEAPAARPNAAGQEQGEQS